VDSIGREALQQLSEWQGLLKQTSPSSGRFSARCSKVGSCSCRVRTTTRIGVSSPARVRSRSFSTALRAKCVGVPTGTRSLLYAARGSRAAGGMSPPARCQPDSRFAAGAADSGSCLRSPPATCASRYTWRPGTRSTSSSVSFHPSAATRRSRLSRALPLRVLRAGTTHAVVATTSLTVLPCVTTVVASPRLPDRCDTSSRCNHHLLSSRAKTDYPLTLSKTCSVTLDSSRECR
jgi:hypothetical protein